MQKINKFRFVEYKFDYEKSEAYLDYAFDEEYFFREKIKFHEAKKSLNKDEKNAIENILFFLHIACGISYYKAFIPNTMVIETGSLSCEQAKFFDKFYKNGLGEFSWRNNLNLSDVIKFPYSEKPSNIFPSEMSLPDITAVPIGGGKDSTVVLETLKAKGEKLFCIAQGRPRPIRETIEVSQCPEIEFTRIISPELIELNKREDVYNGHIPITGIYAFCLALCAVLYGYNKVAMGNERSANVGNLIRDDNFIINHQWSKSLEFEKEFNDFAQTYLLKNFTYFSMLRPLSELDIARRFAMLSDYHQVFTSCNKAFKIDKDKRLERWCGECDKCRFVFLALAPFMPKDNLITAVGRNILADKEQLSGYEELLGLANHKPFECVGELEECVVALHLLAQKNEWKDEYIVRTLYPRLLEKHGLQTIENWQKTVFTKSEEHCLPERFKDYL